MMIKNFAALVFFAVAASAQAQTCNFQCQAQKIVAAGVVGNSLAITGIVTEPDVGVYPIAASSCNDTTINAAVSAAQAKGGGIIQLPVGVCNIANTIAVTQSYIGFSCVGQGSVHNVSFTPTVCSLKWTGASGGTIMSFIAPSGSTSNGAITGNSVRGVSFDGNSGLAANALTIKSLRSGAFENIFAQNFNGGQVLYVGTVHATSSTFGDPCDAQFNTFRNVSINQFYNSSDAIMLDSWTNGTLANLGCNASYNTFQDVNVGYSSGQGIRFVGADNNVFINTDLYENGSGVVGVHFEIYAGGSSNYPANSNVFYHLFTNGAIKANGQATNPSCVAYTSAFGLTSCTQANKIYDLDKLNGTPDPTIETGAQVIWNTTTGGSFSQSTVCFVGSNSCLSYNASSGKFYLTNSSGTNIMSIDNSGNAKFLGTVTASTTP